jgi:hypothetical protein
MLLVDHAERLADSITNQTILLKCDCDYFLKCF